MLKLLLKKQLMEVFRSYFYDAKKNKARSKGTTIAYIVMFVLLMVGVLGGMFAVLANVMCGQLAEMGLDWLYFVIMGMMAVFLGAFGSVFNTYSGLYLAKDNDLLLSMPIPVRIIMASRLLNVYLLGLIYSGIVILPVIIVYWCTVPLTAGIILLLCAMGIVTAPSVSLEGRRLWIVQSLPVEPWQVLRAKLRLHLLCVGAPALVSAVLLAAALRLGAVQAVLLILLTLAFVFFGAQTGLLWGLRLPNLTWTNETAPIKQGAATALALLTGWAAVLLLAGGYILLHGRLAPEGILALAAALLTIVNVLLRRRLQTVGTARFASLQP